MGVQRKGRRVGDTVDAGRICLVVREVRVECVLDVRVVLCDMSRGGGCRDEAERDVGGEVRVGATPGRYLVIDSPRQTGDTRAELRVESGAE